MPTEQEMLPKDKYTIFDRKEKRYRKGIHSTLNLCRCTGLVWETCLDTCARLMECLDAIHAPMDNKPVIGT